METPIIGTLKIYCIDMKPAMNQHSMYHDGEYPDINIAEVKINNGILSFRNSDGKIIRIIPSSFNLIVLEEN